MILSFLDAWSVFVILFINIDIGINIPTDPHMRNPWTSISYDNWSGFPWKNIHIYTPINISIINLNLKMSYFTFSLNLVRSSVETTNGTRPRTTEEAKATSFCADNMFEKYEEWLKMWRGKWVSKVVCCFSLQNW